MGGEPCRFERMAPMPVFEASTSTINGSSGSGWWRMGADVKCDLSSAKTSWVAVDHVRWDEFLLVIEVKGDVTELNWGISLPSPRGRPSSASTAKWELQEISESCCCWQTHETKFPNNSLIELMWISQLTILRSGNVSFWFPECSQERSLLVSQESFFTFPEGSQNVPKNIPGRFTERSQERSRKVHRTFPIG